MEYQKILLESLQTFYTLLIVDNEIIMIHLNVINSNTTINTIIANPYENQKLKLKIIISTEVRSVSKDFCVLARKKFLF